MLLFIQSTACRRIEKRVFQYISCYCLSYLSASDIHWLVISIHLMLLFIEELSIKSVDKLLFQYISCYCLSAKLHLEGSTYLKFQYISCYCLSWRCLHLYGFPEISIHLMLLFIKISEKGN